MTVDSGTAGRGWLAAATGGGLPEPARERWQPLRVGIVALWEYDDAEFWFADGRLVLRGGNGAGKTKILELTTLMLLRGEISASVLDPFGSQHRTMRYNLLPTGDGDDPRPMTDAGLGYAWVEFGRRTASGEAQFLVCGMGASARRGTGSSGVTTWHFVTGQRPGKDLDLVAAGTTLSRKELVGLEGVEVLPSAAAYRARLAHDLFELPPESYRQPHRAAQAAAQAEAGGTAQPGEPGRDAPRRAATPGRPGGHPARRGLGPAGAAAARGGADGGGRRSGRALREPRLATLGTAGAAPARRRLRIGDHDP